MKVISKKKYAHDPYTIWYFIISETIAALTGWLFYKNLTAVLMMTLTPVFFYRRFRSFAEGSKKEAINRNFKDVLYTFSDSAASGKQADAAIVSSYINLKNIYGEEDILTKKFEYMAVRVRETRDSPERLLMEFGRESGIEDIRTFIEIYCICVRNGGNKEKAINKAAGIISEKIMLRQEVSGMLLQKKIEACILCVIPLIVLGFMQIFSPDYSQVLYSGAAGRTVMTCCLCTALWTAYLCLKIMDIKI